MRAEILDAARGQLAAQGAGGLSLRAVARDLGMASSAVYRYFESRDALLTALIIEAYDSLGEWVEEAQASVPREDLFRRWQEIARAVRTWALAHPHLYALVYGSPVPGYAAPQDTVVPASRVTRLLATLLHDIVTVPGGPPDLAEPPLAPRAAAGLAPLVEFMGAQVSPAWAARGLMAWTYVFGAVSLELFGQRVGAIVPDLRAEVYELEIDRVARWLGLVG
jgi:AcrR family transcriptional regulator